MFFWTRLTRSGACWQAIVDAYGMARYKELNPAVFTVTLHPRPCTLDPYLSTLNPKPKEFHLLNPKPLTNP